MNFYEIGDNVFFPLTETYLVYLCKKKKFEKLTIQEACELVFDATAKIYAREKAAPFLPGVTRMLH